MSFTEAIKTCFRKYAGFRGRASRPEFWWFVLFSYVVFLILVIVPFAALTQGSPADQPFDESDGDVAGVVFALVIGLAALGLLVPYLAAGIRRLHDTGKSGWWWLITLVPFGSIVLIVFLATEGDRGWNRYGGPPGIEIAPAPPPGSLPPPPPPA